MKLILFFAILSTFLSAQINTKTVFVIGTKPIMAVRFLNQNKWILIEYKKEKKYFVPQSILDSGTYTQSKWFVKFKSKGSNILKGNKLYLDKKLYQNWITKKNYTKSDTNKYHLLGWIPPKTPYKIPRATVPNPGVAQYTHQFYIRHIHCYAPQYDSLVINDFAGPGIYTTFINDKIIEYRGDTSYSYLISDYETVIHESTHTFNGIFGYSNKRWRYKIMVDPSIIINYDNTETYQTSLFKAIVPPEAPTKIFRYKTYVAPGSTVSANISGIYGLIDEFSAYRNGCHAGITSYLKAKELKRDALAKRFLSQSNGVHFAYYEFRLFFAWYLAYAKQNYPKIYTQLMDNHNFRVAFTLIDDLFLEDVKLLDSINKNETTYDYNYYYENNVKYILSIIPSWQIFIDDYKVKGVTKDNWMEKVKELPPLDPTVTIKKN